MAESKYRIDKHDNDIPVPPGRPMHAVPVKKSSDISEGDHILYMISNNSDYRPIFRSALVISVSSNDKITILVYTKAKGVAKQVHKFNVFNCLHKVEYSCNGTCQKDIAIENAKQRLGECHYHGLYNNSHHLVTRAKTGLEYSLTDQIQEIEEPFTQDYRLKPVLIRSEIKSIAEIRPGDIIMDFSNHYWLVESVDEAQLIFKGFTCDAKNIAILEKVPWKSIYFKINRECPQSINLPNILQRAHNECRKVTHSWDGSDRFVTEMKWGESFAISRARIFDSDHCEPKSCTPVTSNMELNLGDHLLIKSNCSSTCNSVLVTAIIDTDTIVCTPGLNRQESQSPLKLSSLEHDSEVYRVNYSQHLPEQDVMKRAESKEGQQLLQSCHHDSSLFVSWAITGKQSPVNVEDLVKKQELMTVIPSRYMRIKTCDDIQLGDHLFIEKKLCKVSTVYREHVMVTKVCPEPHRYRTVGYLRGSVDEEDQTIDPTQMHVYKVIYTEEFAPEVAIKQAQSRVGEKSVSPWARTEFVRWAKTGSEEGLEVDFMTNTSTPISKSAISCFTQLNQGDYLVIEESKFRPFHHCFVLEVCSPTVCTVMEVWYRSVQQNTVCLNAEHTYYRLNYDINSTVCKPVKESLHLARELKRTSFKFCSKDCRQTFVNFLKTGDDWYEVDVNSLQDDRILLPRKKVESAMHLKRGDHIERLVKRVGKVTDYFHHMLVLRPVDDRRCEVIHCNTGTPSIKREIVDIFETGSVSRIKYTERIDPEEGIAHLMKLTESDSEFEKAKSSEKKKYQLFKNNCEHVVMLGTVGDSMSIQVSTKMYEDLHKITQSLSGICPALKDACIRATAKGGLKGAAKATIATTVRGGAGAVVRQGVADTHKAAVRAALADSFKIGKSAALRGSTVGLVAGLALAINIGIEAPFLVRSLYKIHRKQKFGKMTSAQEKRKATTEIVTSLNTVAGGTLGAIVGQVAIPIPILGAVVGGFLGTLLGKLAGYIEGWSLSQLIYKDDVETDLPVPIHCAFFPMPKES